MKNKSCIATLLLAVFMLGITTSCEDMFDIDSNRVVHDHELNSSADSVYTTLGVLTCMHKVADRYVILGEVRGDMADINDKTKTSIRNIAGFNFDASNEYLKVGDYYAIINNCNYALANMNEDLTINNKLVMMDEYAALLGIRAWTYLQLAINYGDVYYYTYPVTSESDLERAKAEGKKDIKTIAADLALQLTPYLDYDLPSFVGTQREYPILRLVLADLYLWSEDYEKAAQCYEDFFMKNEKYSFTVGKATQPGYLNLGGYFQEWKDADKKIVGPLTNYVTPEFNAVDGGYADMMGDENFSYILKASEVSDLFFSTDNSHYLNPSAAWHSLSSNQMVFKYVDGGTEKKDSLYRSALLGDMRKYRYYNTISSKDVGEFGYYQKHMGYVNTYRRSVACLRWAESMNALAKVQEHVDAVEARENAVNAFYLLKDASRVFFPDSSEVMKRFLKAANEDEWRTPFIGVHGRGCGDVRYDTTYYVLKPTAIASRLGKESAEEVNFSDTIRYIDELIIDELALESTLEGNRFGDLVRFAHRRQVWGDSDYRDFLASRVADKSGERVDTLYNKLNDSEMYWYLPFK